MKFMVTRWPICPTVHRAEDYLANEPWKVIIDTAAGRGGRWSGEGGTFNCQPSPVWSAARLSVSLTVSMSFSSAMYTHHVRAYTGLPLQPITLTHTQREWGKRSGKGEGLGQTVVSVAMFTFCRLFEPAACGVLLGFTQNPFNNLILPQ